MQYQPASKKQAIIIREAQSLFIWNAFEKLHHIVEH